MDFKSIVFSLVIFIFSTVGFADVRLPAIISDNMVLQQKTEVPIWGWADAGEKVKVKGSWQWVGKSTVANEQGKWQVKIKTPKASGPLELTIKGENTIVLKNVLAGEVWVCSGQSNMAFSVRRANNGEAAVASANLENIRLFVVKREKSQTPLSDCKGNWKVCSPETVAGFSAVGYFFGRELHDELKVPVGLIGTYWGGTVVEAWTKQEALKTDPDCQAVLESYAESKKAQNNYELAMKKWEQASEMAKDANKSTPKKPRKPASVRPQNAPSALYNAMISPLIPYRIKGAIWYQGEANVNRAYQYRKLFPAMIQNWRTDWQQGDFPFYYVQIAPFKYENDKSKNKPQGSAAELREAQLMTLSLANTGMAVTMDIGNKTNIHPKNKLDVGKRLSLWALAKDYGRKDLVYSGPVYKSMQIDGNKIRLSFDHIGSGLMAKDGPLSEFTIAGTDKIFVPAQATIDGDTILVKSDLVKKPVEVRFAWENASVPNLFNKEGLPASSFRTDDWPCVTKNRK